MYSNMKTAIAVTSRSITNIITHTDALNGSERERKKEIREGLSINARWSQFSHVTTPIQIHACCFSTLHAPTYTQTETDRQTCTHAHVHTHILTHTEWYELDHKDADSQLFIKCLYTDSVAYMQAHLISDSVRRRAVQEVLVSAILSSL